MMLSRAAWSLYWIGRYVERAEFTADLVEATLRLDSLAVRPAGLEAWASALEVASAKETFNRTGAPWTDRNISMFLLLSTGNPSSVRSCIDGARANARALRTALSREAWLSINRAWMRLHTHDEVEDTGSIMALAEEIKGGAREFEGATHRMLRNEAQFFVRMGAAIERANGTARLLDVKYHLLLPSGEPVGGTADRDQWAAILRTVSATAAYRWLYREGLKPWLVAELLVLRDELPRSLRASVEEVAALLKRISKLTGREGPANRLVLQQRSALRETNVSQLIQSGLHEFLIRFLSDVAKLDQAIASQFRFGLNPAA